MEAEAKISWGVPILPVEPKRKTNVVEPPPEPINHDPNTIKWYTPQIDDTPMFQEPRFRGIRLHPNLFYNPKSALYDHYLNQHKVKLEASDFFTCRKGPPHAQRFTTVFVCPMTGECFPSGRYEWDDFEVDEDNVVFYTKKANAEHGASARAYDCLIHRQNDGDKTLCDYVGKEDPTTSNLPIPEAMEETAKIAIREAMQFRRITDKMETAS